MSDREDAARKFAEVMGWEAQFYDMPSHHVAVFVSGEECIEAYLPKSDTELPTHLAFVGRVAEALEMRPYLSWTEDNAHGVPLLGFDHHAAWSAADLSWAAMLAAIAVKETK